MNVPLPLPRTILPEGITIREAPTYLRSCRLRIRDGKPADDGFKFAVQKLYEDICKVTTSDVLHAYPRIPGLGAHLFLEPKDALLLVNEMDFLSAACLRLAIVCSAVEGKRYLECGWTPEKKILPLTEKLVHVCGMDDYFDRVASDFGALKRTSPFIDEFLPMCDPEICLLSAQFENLSVQFWGMAYYASGNTYPESQDTIMWVKTLVRLKKESDARPPLIVGELG